MTPSPQYSCTGESWSKAHKCRAMHDVKFLPLDTSAMIVPGVEISHEMSINASCPPDVFIGAASHLEANNTNLAGFWNASLGAEPQFQCKISDVVVLRIAGLI